MNQKISETGCFRLARAIAKAEGFYVTNSRPARNHNPGDLTIDGIGKKVGMDGQYVKYANDGDGWDALMHQCRLMLSGRSRIYTPILTIEEVGRKWTQTEQDAWIQNVAAALRCPKTVRICDLT